MSYPFIGLGSVLSRVIEIVWVSFHVLLWCTYMYTIILHDDKKRKLENEKTGEKDDNNDVDVKQIGELNEKGKLEMDKVKVERTHTLGCLYHNFVINVMQHLRESKWMPS